LKEQKIIKVFMIQLTYTRSNPKAMMIIFINACVTFKTMSNSILSLKLAWFTKKLLRIMILLFLEIYLLGMLLLIGINKYFTIYLIRFNIITQT
jgi:hypothetical protein